MQGDKSNNTKIISILDPIGRNFDLVLNEGRLVRLEGSTLRAPFQVTDKTGVIAVIGDTHGHLSCALNWLSVWMLFSGQNLDLILQVGDLTDETVNCSPTSRKYRGLPSDLGLEDLTPGSNKLAALFKSNPRLAPVSVAFIAGNHDSEAVAMMHERLGGDSPFHPNFWYLENGTTLTAYNFFSVNPSMRLAPGLRISSLGWDATTHDCTAVAAAKPDILLTHTVDSRHSRGPYSKCTRGFHFFGHHPDALQMSKQAKKSFGLEHVAPANRNNRPGSVGVLFLSEEDSGNEDDGVFLYLPTTFGVESDTTQAGF